MQANKRRLTIGLVATPGLLLLGGCLMSNAKADDASTRFKDVGVVLVVDAVPGAELLAVEFYADNSKRRFFASSLVAKRNRAVMAFPLERPPMQVRVVWRKSTKGAQVGWGSASYYDELGRPKENYIPPAGVKFSADDEIAKRKAIAAATGVPHHGPWGSEYGDEILGDYTLPIASRIPDSVIDALKRNRKGDLRLKFRLKPDGVLFGWDIERRPGWKPGLSVRPVYEEVGGDFVDTFY